MKENDIIKLLNNLRDEYRETHGVKKYEMKTIETLKYLKNHCKYATYANICSYCIFYNDKNKRCVLASKPSEWDFKEAEAKANFLKGE